MLGLKGYDDADPIIDPRSTGTDVTCSFENIVTCEARGKRRFPRNPGHHTAMDRFFTSSTLSPSPD